VIVLIVSRKFGGDWKGSETSIEDRRRGSVFSTEIEMGCAAWGSPSPVRMNLPIPPDKIAALADLDGVGKNTPQSE
jgi:hypothetical protein